MSLTLGPFAVADDGVLALRAPQARPALRFAWRGRRCEAALEADGLHLAAIAARIPSTAEPGCDRSRAFDAVSALPHALPAGWQVRLLPDHRVRVETTSPLDGPTTATGLVTALVRFALTLDPLLDRLESAGVACPPLAPH